MMTVQLFMLLNTCSTVAQKKRVVQKKDSELLKSPINDMKTENSHKFVK